MRRFSALLRRFSSAGADFFSAAQKADFCADFKILRRFCADFCKMARNLLFLMEMYFLIDFLVNLALQFTKIDGNTAYLGLTNRNVPYTVLAGTKFRCCFENLSDRTLSLL